MKLYCVTDLTMDFTNLDTRRCALFVGTYLLQLNVVNHMNRSIELAYVHVARTKIVQKEAID